ncbi:unnamed protein product, partial [Prorocentrum cordatum]
DVRELFRGGHVDPGGAVLAVTLAHLREPERQARGRGPGVDQWERLRLLVAAEACRRGLCAAPVPWRVQQRAVATEFWLLGRPGDAWLADMLEAQCAEWA